MADNVLIIPATVSVGRDFPQYLPLPNGDLKPAAECSRSEVGDAVAECRELTRASRARLEAAYREHLEHLELLAQVSAYHANFDAWSAVREGKDVRERLWQVEADL